MGVAPPDFRFPDKTDVWIPANTALPETTSRSGHNYRVVARLKAGVTLHEAQAEMTTIAARLEQLYPPSNKNKSAVVISMRDDMVSNVRLTLELLLASVWVVLLIACANIANLLLAKATGRAREIAIRAAMGASRTRIVRQLLTESALIALAAGAAGLAIAILSLRILMRLAPHDIPRLNEAGLDLRALAFTCGVSLISTVLFGIAPAFQASALGSERSAAAIGSARKREPRIRAFARRAGRIRSRTVGGAAGGGGTLVSQSSRAARRADGLSARKSRGDGYGRAGIRPRGRAPRHAALQAISRRSVCDSRRRYCRRDARLAPRRQLERRLLDRFAAANRDAECGSSTGSLFDRHAELFRHHRNPA